MLDILFCVNESEECHRASKKARAMFPSHLGYNFTLLHISPEIIFYAESGIVDYKSIEDKENAKIDALFDTFKREFEADGYTHVNTLHMSDKLEVVMKNIQDKYALIVIGDTEEGFFHRLFASNMLKFIEVATIPILIAK